MQHIKNRRTFLKQSLFLAGIFPIARPLSAFLSEGDLSTDKEPIRFRMTYRRQGFGIKIGEAKGKHYLSIHPLKGKENRAVYTFDPKKVEERNKKEYRNDTLTIRINGKNHTISLKELKLYTDCPGVSFPDPVPPSTELLGVILALVACFVAVSTVLFWNDLVDLANHKKQSSESGFMLEPGLEEEPTVWY